MLENMSITEDSTRGYKKLSMTPMQVVFEADNPASVERQKMAHLEDGGFTLAFKQGEGAPPVIGFRYSAKTRDEVITLLSGRIGHLKMDYVFDEEDLVTWFDELSTASGVDGKITVGGCQWMPPSGRDEGIKLPVLILIAVCRQEEESGAQFFVGEIVLAVMNGIAYMAEKLGIADDLGMGVTVQ